MTSAQLSLVIQLAGAVLSLVTIVFLAGALKGAVSTRLDHIEARLTEIEHAMRRAGFTVRGTVEEP